MANELSKKIKQELISKTGLKARALSVRYKIVGHSDEVSIGVKNERFPLSIIEDIANKYKSIDYCQASGEILSGGNTYISVTYPWDKPMTQEFKNELEVIVTPCLSLELGNADDFELKRWITEKAVTAIQEYMNNTEKETYTENDARDILYKYNN